MKAWSAPTFVRPERGRHRRWLARARRRAGRTDDAGRAGGGPRFFSRTHERRPHADSCQAERTRDEGRHHGSTAAGSGYGDQSGRSASRLDRFELDARGDGQTESLAVPARRQPSSADYRGSQLVRRPSGILTGRTTDCLCPHSAAGQRQRGLGLCCRRDPCSATGGRLRRPPSGCFSPVWLSDTQLVYVRDPKIDRQPDMELWQVDADKGSTERVLRFDDVLPGRGAHCHRCVTGPPVACWSRLSAAVSGRRRTCTCWIGTAARIRPLWQDPAGDYKDARPLWSPTGRDIALAPQFHARQPGQSDPLRRGHRASRAMATAGTSSSSRTSRRLSRRWHGVPTAISCCARGREASGAKTQQLLLMDIEFRVTEELFRTGRSQLASRGPRIRESGGLGRSFPPTCLCRAMPARKRVFGPFVTLLGKVHAKSRRREVLAELLSTLPSRLRAFA